MYLKINYKIIILISLTFSLMVGSKFYGFGHDYYIAYHEQNITWGAWHDMMGWRISTLTIYDKHIGVHLVSFILSLSFGILLKKFFEIKGLKSLFIFTLIYILSLHTWPIIMSTSNAMRQGITMSLIFISFSYLLESKNFKSFFFIFISIFTHKSGIIFLIIFFNVFLIKFLLSFIKKNKGTNFIYFIYSVFLCVSFYYLLLLSKNVDIYYSRIIEGDYRYPFVIISFMYVMIFSYKIKFLQNNDVILFLYLFCFSVQSVLFLGLNWEYERFMMMMTLPIILAFCILLNKRSTYFYLIFSISSLLSLTIYNGMYKSLT